MRHTQCSEITTFPILICEDVLTMYVGSRGAGVATTLAFATLEPQVKN